MDPNQVWRDLADAFGRDWLMAGELADALLHWLDRGGFPPRITGNEEFDRCVCRRVCQAIGAWEVF